MKSDKNAIKRNLPEFFLFYRKIMSLMHFSGGGVGRANGFVDNSVLGGGV